MNVVVRILDLVLSLFQLSFILVVGCVSLVVGVVGAVGMLVEDRLFN
jgi:hypothetical protein